MTQTPAGWHPDPHVPGQQRFWDGTSWTDQVAPLGPSAAAYGAAGQQHGQQYGQQYAGPPTTPDGQQLAGWWRRVAASVIDGVVLIPVSIVVGWSWWSHVFSEYGHFIRESIDASESGSTPPSATDLQGDLFGDLVVIALIGVALNFVYVVGFLAWKQATLGKLAMGTRVRLRETPGRLPLKAILLRWLVQYGPSSLGFVPLVGTATSLWYLLDSLWPLWDSEKQALHDKAAKTSVVMHRRS
ncbi:RDD family protein [Nocardioides plantarum]|uniref:RDD family protein n=1 Tax=Nocardioides plantarum TaxID=29299 RepID=A0ABV5KC72_9ACTN|nr:RDD family protein [Nocardioides plantarum]